MASRLIKGNIRLEPSYWPQAELPGRLPVRPEMATAWQKHWAIPLLNCVPGLVPLVVEEVELAKSMQGVSLKNVSLTAYQCPADEIDHFTWEKRNY